MGEQDNRPVSRTRWVNYGLQLLAIVISFALGSLTGSVNSYIGVRQDEAALAATVSIQGSEITSITETMRQWRSDDQKLIANVQTQLADVSGLLTDLRIRLGPKYR